MGLLKQFFRPLWNSRFVFWLRGSWFELAEILTDYKVEKSRFLKSVGYELNLQNPKTFSEHLVWKKLYDRNPILPIISDKYQVREYLKNVLGNEEAEKILVPLLYVTDDPATLPFDSLTGEYIIKANHNSGPNFIVEKGKEIDRKVIVSSLKEQLRLPYATLKHEWAYKKIKKRVVIVERLLRDKTGFLPKDYKFHMIYGHCAFVQVDFDRFIDHSRTLYDKDWNYIPGTLKFKQGPEAPKPKNFEGMLALAETLSKDFDYVRIDLYNLDGQIYFGEMTNYPGSGIERFTPINLDVNMGEYWNKNDTKRS